MKHRMHSVFLFIGLFMSCFITYGQSGLEKKVDSQMPKDSCSVLLKARLRNIFLNGGMGGHKVFAVQEVIRGSVTDSLLWIPIIHIIDYRDVLICINDTNSRRIEYSLYVPENRMDPLPDYIDQPKGRLVSVNATINPTEPDTNDYPDFSKTSPVDFLMYLQNFRLTCLTIHRQDIPQKWISEEHIDTLLKLMESSIPAIPVYEDYNVDRIQYPSTIGTEALFLLEGYIAGKYPPGQCSLGYWNDKMEKIVDIEMRKKNVLQQLKKK